MTHSASVPPPAAAPLVATPDAPRVSVRGSARLEVDPEIARIGVVVTARGADRAAALTDLTRRNGAALGLLSSYGEAIESTATGSFSITPELTRRGRGEHVRTYHGHVHIQATVGDFTMLGELTTRLADLELTRVDGPWWALRPSSPVHREARRQAVREAVTRAREYAAALGSDLAALVELADIGVDSEPHAIYAGAAARGAAPGGAAESGVPSLDLEPRRQTVHAHINARFTITPPVL
ncbi:SIMPL domain-containing protein [Streptomyces johnsoniae]|uniref:SIMPL domain-containing protein n=1 Tax=Streptomyces johnsoniae TaxID=3075532 RepID=A0ABU2RXI8_9ACTN|nr:SIMPL domain-containing protein [Streptomyces sp. DSM 41886]MDT0441473.1 SIMPL domain-containing protein [Streptomyces sp. DSM 41886]